MTVSSALKAILGPTNTGKTYFAIERMLAHPSGMIGLPLRLLAREVYNRVVERVGPQLVALVTGEERIVPHRAKYWIATVEAMPVEMPVDIVVIDEVQTAIDFDRGHVFTNRILHARGIHETLLLGAGTMAPIIRALLPQAEIINRPRLSALTYAGSKKISRQPERSAIVAFSAAQVYAIAELIRRERGGAAVVMGALSPRTRNAQVEMFENGDVDFLVATDAIGMGLNLDIRHIAFADDRKFDGRQTRPLTPAEFGQIAGRAGRHTRNGTFGVTSGVGGFEEDLIVALESHDFEPIKILQWRNSALDFSSLTALHHSLELTPQSRLLTRVPIATDQLALEFLARNEAGALATDPEAVRLLWECCQIPDYRNISPAQHGELVTKVFTDLRRRGHVEPEWLAEQVRFCDNISGDIDTLSNRIKQVRTWTFIANRKNWLADAGLWREKTREIEDRLSDALHERLTQRFVDRRTSVLLRHLKDKRMVSPEINDRGEVSLEGHLIGTIEGFRFTLSRSDVEADAKALRSAADQVVAPEIVKRADRVAGAPNEEFVLATDGRLRWRGEILAELVEGDSLLRPRVLILADESLTGVDLARVQDRLDLWLRHHVNTLLEPVMALAEPVDLDGAARGIAFQLSENLGILPRSAVSEEVKGLDQDVRAKMRKLGVKFGAYHIYLPLSLKPAPRELALILYALKHGGIRQPGVSDLPHTVLSGRTSFHIDPEIALPLYEIAGFKVAGKRAVRVDILERLADIIRPLIALDASRHAGDVPNGAAEGNGFRVTVEMTSLLGCSGEEFASILTALGYRVRRVPKVAVAPVVEAPALVPVSDDRMAEISALADTLANEPEGAEASVEIAVPEPTVAEAAPLVEAPPVEPQFDEIWFPGGRNPGAHQSRGPRRDSATAPEGETTERPRHSRRPPRDRTHIASPAAVPTGGDSVTQPSEPQPQVERPRFEKPRFDKPRFDKPKFDRPTNDKPRFEKPRREAEKPVSSEPRREKRETSFDPDSPFAALAVLKNRKPE